MGFDMSAGEREESIRHGEEYILQMVAEDAKCYPQLYALWRAFFDDPRFSPQQAEAMVHELIELLDRHGNGGRERNLTHSVLRWLAFFSYAARGGHEIETYSD